MPFTTMQKEYFREANHRWNVRAGSSAKHKVICVVKGNTYLTADKADPETGWYHIPSLDGWISYKGVTQV